MKQFQLCLQFTIDGIGATSGLVYRNNSLYIIADNSSFLYEYQINEKKLNKIQLSKNSKENIIKKNKPDFESITLFNNKLFLFGSGSTQKRKKRVTYNLENGDVKEKKLTKFYKKLQNNASLSDDELNIEGIIIDKENYYLFQRGNGISDKNGIFNYNKITKDITFNEIILPKIDDVEATFTDSILIDDSVYFLAAVENTSSTYNDGEIFGSFIGSLNLLSMKINFIQKISDNKKFEGLTLLDRFEKQIEFLLCEDNDTEELISNIYKLTI